MPTHFPRADQSADWSDLDAHVSPPYIMAAAVDHVQAAYGEKYDSVMMFNSKRDVSALLHDEDKCRAYEQKSSQKKQQEHGSEQKEKYKHPEQER